MKADMNDHDRLAKYVERVFAASKQTEWPTVRRAAHALGWTQDRVEAACDGDPRGLLYLSSYFTCPEQALGEHFVERLA